MNETHRFAHEAGFTLLEILLVVVIIGMLVSVAAVKIGGQSQKAKLVATQRQIDAYKTTLGVYELENGFYPSTEQGLQALITQPTTPPVPTNWKGPYLDPPVLRPGPVGTRLHLQDTRARAIPPGTTCIHWVRTGVEGDEDDIGNWQ